MASQEKIQALTDLLKEVLNPGSDINVSEVPYIRITGDIDGKGILWSGNGNNKQFVFNSGPDRFFVSENIDLGKGKSYSVNNVNVLSEKELGPSVTKSSLREVGRLKGLIVDGGLSVNQFLFYDANTDRLGIGTDQPKAAINLIDQNIDIVLGASETNKGSVGTANYSDFEIITDNTSRITIQAGGNIVLGNPSAGEVKVVILGKLGVNVSNPDPRSALHVNGALKFNDKLHLNGSEPPTSGSYNEGDIVWNSFPHPGKFVGWVCIKSGNPGMWNGFGRIE